MPEMPSVDLEQASVRELNQRLHELGPGTNETEWKVTNPLGRHAIACLAGLAPFADDSGDAQAPRHIKGGRAQPRRALYWAALAAARYNPDLAIFYKRLRDNGKKPKVALTAVMRKIAVLANTLLREDRLWLNHCA